jgi:hypothetical protein
MTANPKPTSQVWVVFELDVDTDRDETGAVSSVHLSKAGAERAALEIAAQYLADELLFAPDDHSDDSLAFVDPEFATYTPTAWIVIKPWMVEP